MKKFMVCVAFFLIFCVGAAYYAEFNFPKASEPSSNIKTVEDSKLKQIVEPPIKKECKLETKEVKQNYRLKEYEGNIAVFKEGSNLPIKTTSISVKELPQADRDMLKEGINASSEEELSALLEDYGS